MKRFTLIMILLGGFLWAENLVLEVEATGFSGDGTAYVLLFEDGQKFNAKCKDCLSKQVEIKNNQINVVFDSLAVNDYAIMIYHDENDNGKMDTNFIGIPKEGVGVSNNTGGIPSFKKSKLLVEKNTKIKIEMNYL